MFSLSQTGGRLPQQKGKYFEYPFIETLLYANLTIFKLNKNEKFLSEFDPQRIVYTSPIKRERENSGRCQLKAGEKYVVVCSTEMGSQTGDLYLSVYFNQYMRDVEIKRAFHPSDKSLEEVLPYFIPEEAEKLVSQTPLWKLQLVRESLKFMMTDEDTRGSVKIEDVI